MKQALAGATPRAGSAARAGKTTLVPLALLDAAWLGGHKIVMLEPRRLAARAAARRMAAMLGRAGRRHRRLSHAARDAGRPRTRIEVVTDGILPRMLQDDPALDGIGFVIFDEFHERSLDADLGLALCLETSGAARGSALLVMSATLDGARVAALLGAAPVIGAPAAASRSRCAISTASRPARFEDAVAARCGARSTEERAAPGLPARRRRDPPRRAAARATSAPTSTSRRSTATCAGGAGRAPRAGAGRAAARSCWRPRSPRPASPSRASAS